MNDAQALEIGLPASAPPARVPWLRNHTPRDRAAVVELGKWLAPVEWQVLATLTFPWPAHAETAELKLRQYINDIEREYRTGVGVVAGEESNPSGPGPLIPTHFHLLIASKVPLSHETLRRLWYRQIGQSYKGRAHSNHALILPYDHSRPGIE
jgi:hypothetical protein